MSPDHRIAPDEISSAQQQIEKVHRAFAGLEPLVLIHAAEQLRVQHRRKVGIGSYLKFRERSEQRVSSREDLCARHTLGIGRATSLARTLDVPIAP